VTADIVRREHAVELDVSESVWSSVARKEKNKRASEWQIKQTHNQFAE